MSLVIGIFLGTAYCFCALLFSIRPWKKKAALMPAPEPKNIKPYLWMIEDSEVQKTQDYKNDRALIRPAW